MFYLFKIIQIILFITIFFKSPEGNAMDLVSLSSEEDFVELTLDSIEDQKKSYGLSSTNSKDTNCTPSNAPAPVPVTFISMFPRDVWKEIYRYIPLPRRLELGYLSKLFSAEIHDRDYLYYLNQKIMILFKNIDMTNRVYSQPHYSRESFDTLNTISLRINLLTQNANLDKVQQEARNTFILHSKSACDYLKVCENYISHNLNKLITERKEDYSTFNDKKIEEHDFITLSTLYNYQHIEQDNWTIFCLNAKGYAYQSYFCCQSSLICLKFSCELIICLPCLCCFGLTDKPIYR